MDIHLTAEIVAALRQGDLDQVTFSRIILDHLRAVCPTCRAEMERTGHSPDAEGEHWGCDPATERLRRAGLRLRELPAIRERAEREFALLLRAPAGERIGMVERARRRFRGPAFAERLLAEARAHLPHDPQGAFHFAALAERVAARTTGGEELEALALAHQANARRCLGFRPEAVRRFAAVRDRIRRDGLTDLALYAEIDMFEGVLARDLRSFDVAEVLLSRSLMFSSSIGDDLGSARALLSLSAMENERGDSDRAIQFAEEAVDLLAGQDQERLELAARFNVAWYLAEASRFSEARAALNGLTRVLERFPDPWTLLRARWLEGGIAAGLGEREEAEAAFREVRDGFLREHVGYDAALASLDLAGLLLESGRWAEVRKLAEEITALFSAENVRRETLTALLLFQEAVRQETATAAGIAELREHLESHRQNRRAPARG